MGEADTDQKTFQCELIGPAGKLLDCRTTSVVFPAHDGQVGILYDHMPMLSQLGLGIMRVAQSSERGPRKRRIRREAKFFIDGGFALVAENSVTIIAYDALALQRRHGRGRRIPDGQGEQGPGEAGPVPCSAGSRERANAGLQKVAESIKS